MTNSVKWYDRGRYICRYVAEIYASQQDVSQWNVVVRNGTCILMAWCKTAVTLVS